MIWRPWQRWLGVLCLAALLILYLPRSGVPPMVGVPDWQEALPLLEQQARQPGADPAVKSRLLDGYLALGKNDQALALLERDAAQLDPNGREQLCRLAMVSKRPEAALRSLLPLRRQLADGELQHLASFALAARDQQAACRVYEVLLVRHPADQATRDQLVSLWLARERPDCALDCFEAGQAWPNALEWHRRAAQLADWAKLPARAVPHRLAIFEVLPNLETGEQALAAMRAAHDSRATEFTVRLALATADRDACESASRELSQAGHEAQALRLLLWRAERLPDDREAHETALQRAIADRHLLTAIAEQRRWLVQSPSAVAWHQLANLYAHANSPESALGAYGKAFIGHPPQELAWRLEALALASPLDDLTAAGRENLQRLSELDARNVQIWRRLATAEAESANWSDAARAQQHLIALAPSPVEQVRLVRWLLRAHQDDEALRKAQQCQRLPEDVLKQLAQIAAVASAGSDGADDCLDRALALEPDDPTILTALAERRFYGPQPLAAQPLLERLAKLSPSARGLRLLADWALPLHPAQARRWLLELEQLEPDARSALQLGQAEAALGNARAAQADWSRAAARPGGPDEEQARANALDLLGRHAEAAVIWQRLYATQPQRLKPALALARLALAEGHAAAATAPYWRAQTLAPKTFETRLLGLDYLEATGHERMALAAIRDLRKAAPQWRDGPLREAEADERLGRSRQAWLLGRTVLAHEPNDQALQGWYHGLREQGAGKVAVQARSEQSASLNLTTAGVSARMPVSDSVQMAAELRHLSWPQAVLDEGGLQFDWRTGAWHLGGGVTVPRGESPLARLAARWQAGPTRVRVSYAGQRWEVSSRALTLGLREQTLATELSWHVPHWQLDARGSAGALTGTAGLLADSTLQAAWLPEAGGNWALAYELQANHWGAAGTLAALPSDSLLHSVLLRYELTRGPFVLQLSPGYGLEAFSGLEAPLLDGRLSFDWGLDRTLSLELGWSPHSLLSGLSAPDERLSLEGSWYL